jgi:hypothetical protein
MRHPNHDRSMTSWRRPTVALFLALTGACGIGQSGGDEATPGEQTKSLHRDLSRDMTGDDVRIVQEYLRRFGYFPNASLQNEYPAWRPLVASGPERLGVYDRQTQEAVRIFQANMGIAQTGVVDEATRTILQTPRCGEPEGIAHVDPSAKFAQTGTKWSKTNLTWRVFNSDDVTLVQARSAASAAFATWFGQTSLTFTEVTSGSADIEISFGAIDGAGNVAAQSGTPEFSDMTIDTAETWSVATPTPAGQLDLQTIMVHELGHGLGLHHSSISNAVMFPFVSFGVQNRATTVDDNVGISSLYDVWEQLPGQAKDIAVGADGSAWMISTTPIANGDFGIAKFVGGSWISAPGGAQRIAVGPTGVPWIVNNVGTIFRLSNNDPTTGVWSQLAGSAQDIGVGADGSAWIIGTTLIANGDFGIAKFNGSTWDNAPGGAKRIAVGPSGVPWIVNNVGTIFRFSNNNPATGTWSQLPGVAKDIGINDGNYAWVIGTFPRGTAGDFSIHVFDEQAAFGTAPAKNEWLGVSGGAVTISAGPNGRPWIVNSVGTIFRAPK